MAQWLVVPGSIKGRTIYHVHALRAAAGRGLPALTGWLDHVAALGCGAVLFTPIHESSNHGYDTVDALRLDPRLGTDADLDHFVIECKSRDLGVLFDGVFNHAGRAFQRPDWFSGRTWEGHDDLPALDHDNPEVLAWATPVARHWLDRCGDGWRFDVAYAIPRPFLRQLTTRVRAVRPDAFLFGEMIHGDYAGIVHDTGLDGVTQYELFKAIWSSLNDANMWELAWALDRHRHFAQSFVPVTFVGNHDVTRIATNLTNPDNLELALAVLFTVPGVPCVYYGDELGWTGSKRKGAGGDDAIRPALPESVPTHIPRSSSTAGGSSSATHDPGSPTHPLRSSARPTASCVSGGCLAAASRVTAARRRRSHGGIGRQSQGAERMDRLAARAATTAGIRGFPAPRLRSAPLPSSPGWSPSSATARAEHQFGAPRAR